MVLIPSFYFRMKSGEEKSSAHYSLESAMAAGYNGANCAQTYSSCMFSGSDIMNLVRLFTSNLPRNSMSIVRDFIEK